MELEEERNPERCATIFLQHLGSLEFDALFALKGALEESAHQDHIPAHKELAQEIGEVALKTLTIKAKQVYTHRNPEESNLALASIPTSKVRETPTGLAFRWRKSATSTDMKEDWIEEFKRIFNFESSLKLPVPKTVDLSRPSGFMLSKQHNELVVLMIRFRRTNAITATNSVKYLMEQNVPSEIKQIGIAAGVPSTCEAAAILSKSCDDVLTRSNDHPNSLLLQLRLHSNLAECHYWKHCKNRQKAMAHLEAAIQLSSQCSNDYTAVYSLMMKALVLVDEGGDFITESDLLLADKLSHQAVKRASQLPEWTVPFMERTRLDKLRVDLAVARKFKRDGQLEACKYMLKKIHDHIKEIDKELLSVADEALLGSIQAIAYNLDGNEEMANKYAEESCLLYMGVGWFGGALRTAKQVNNQRLIKLVTNFFEKC